MTRKERIENWIFAGVIVVGLPFMILASQRIAL
jgi:hypothetical protein